MLISNGMITRYIAAEKLSEYKAKGYAAVEKPAAKPAAGKGAAKKAGA